MKEAITRDWRPDYGGLTCEFEFDPLPYGAGAARRKEFKERIQASLQAYGFLFSSEISVRWRLFVDEQDRWETSEGADVDNFAKLLNDSIKGPSGLLFDDCQVQGLEIEWHGTPGSPYFDLSIQCHPDETVSKPATFYEMSDGLWYPIANFVTEHEQLHAQALHVIDDKVQMVRTLRHLLRQGGLNKKQAFMHSKGFLPAQRGFHKTRIIDSGFACIQREEWLQKLDFTAIALDSDRADVSDVAHQYASNILTSASRDI